EAVLLPDRHVGVVDVLVLVRECVDVYLLGNRRPRLEGGELQWKRHARGGCDCHCLGRARDRVEAKRGAGGAFCVVVVVRGGAGGGQTDLFVAVQEFRDRRFDQAGGGGHVASSADRLVDVVYLEFDLTQGLLLGERGELAQFDQLAGGGVEGARDRFAHGLGYFVDLSDQVAHR